MPDDFFIPRRIGANIHLDRDVRVLEASFCAGLGSGLTAQNYADELAPASTTTESSANRRPVRSDCLARSKLQTRREWRRLVFLV